MGILARLVDGVNVADIGVLLALVWLVVRLEWTRSENTIAHDGITRNIDGVRHDLNNKIDGVRHDLNNKIDGVKRDLTEKIDGVRQDLTKKIDGVRQDLTEKIDGVRQDLTEKIDSVKQGHTKDIDGVKQDVGDVKQDVKKLLTGDVAWMQTVLRDRQPSE